MKWCICHFTKWLIHSFISEVTFDQIILPSYYQLLLGDNIDKGASFPVLNQHPPISNMVHVSSNCWNIVCKVSPTLNQHRLDCILCDGMCVYSWQCWAKRQTAVNAYFKRKHLLRFTLNCSLWTLYLSRRHDHTCWLFKLPYYHYYTSRLHRDLPKTWKYMQLINVNKVSYLFLIPYSIRNK